MASFTHYRVKNEHQIPELAGQADEEVTGDYMRQLRNNLHIEIRSLTEELVEFDLIGVDASVANALRRIMLAEVPTIAIESVWMAVNSSIIHDEVLSHRMGLIPIKADPSKLEYIVGDESTDRDTIVFHFDVECSLDDQGNMVNESAYSGQLEWLPQGGQEAVFPEGVAPVHDDIVIAKLRPGQRIEFEAHCRKGLGKDHAKFSPVATASYRLMPEIIIPTPITGDEADQLKEMCPLNVFDIEDLGSRRSAAVARPRDCTMCRECIRHEGWESKVLLKRKVDHFLFSVESTGCMPAETVVREAIGVLREKAQQFQQHVDQYQL